MVATSGFPNSFQTNRSQLAGNSVATTLSLASKQLQNITDTARLEAELLLGQVLGRSRDDFYTWPERVVNTRELTEFDQLLQRRVGGEPLPYITGKIEFYGLDFMVDPRVLIPRAETERLVDFALETAMSHRSDPHSTSDSYVIVDVGTGSGCIAIALALHLPDACIYGLDLSEAALAVGRANAQRHGVSSRIAFQRSDMLAALPVAADLIVANPPYVASSEWPMLSRSVRGFEPRLALDGGSDGLAAIADLLDTAPDGLRAGGSVLIEIGADQGNAVRDLARRSFPNAYIDIHTDLSGHDRILVVQTQVQ